ncbi:MAG TPA: hypothetical protein VNU21_09540, partial [Usitatibacter sp.]|nr:hypothetical protein [Usitatibacter sp.]
NEWQTQIDDRDHRVHRASQPLKETLDMSTSHFRNGRRLLAAVLIASVGFAYAASGVRVTRQQEVAVKVGMTTDEVRQLLGRPDSAIKYRNEPGPTWTYQVVGNGFDLEFNIVFSDDGKVTSARESVVPSRG